MNPSSTINDGNYRTIRLKSGLMHFDSPKVMGILNVTPDSFFSGSRMNSRPEIIARVKQIMDEGADIIDIGGYSSRPGAEDISADEEYSRLATGLEEIRKSYPEAVVSVDTFRAAVARKCVEGWGADIINDISGGTLDPEMWDTVADLKVPYVLMHMRGTPATMKQLTDYTDVTADVLSDLAKKTAELHQRGVADVIIDPGFGFAKDVEQNYQLLADLREFRQLGPVLSGISRKTMIWKPLGITPEEAGNGTTVLNTISLLNGADILRVHDVRQAVECVRLTSLLKTANNV